MFTEDTWEPTFSGTLPAAAKSTVLQTGINVALLGPGCWLPAPAGSSGPSPAPGFFRVILSCSLPLAVLEGCSDRRSRCPKGLWALGW